MNETTKNISEFLIFLISSVGIPLFSLILKLDYIILYIVLIIITIVLFLFKRPIYALFFLGISLNIVSIYISYDYPNSCYSDIKKIKIPEYCSNNCRYNEYEEAVKEKGENNVNIKDYCNTDYCRISKNQYSGEIDGCICTEGNVEDELIKDCNEKEQKEIRKYKKFRDGQFWGALGLLVVIILIILIILSIKYNINIFEAFSA